MNDSTALYDQLLEINEVSFAQGLFTVSYHALSGALYCALSLNDKEKRVHVEELAASQQERLKVHFAEDGDLHDGYSQEPLEIVLYRSLRHIANPRISLTQPES